MRKNYPKAGRTCF